MKKARELLKKYQAGLATEDEKAIIETWYLKYKTGKSDLKAEELFAEQELGLHTLHRSIQKGTTRNAWPLMAVAASVVLLVIGSLFYFSDTPTERAVIKQKAMVTDIVPGGNKAILTLADGKKISLTDVAVGEILSNEEIQIEKMKDGQLVYKSTGRAVGYNTIETPVGGEYQVNLPDGSKVWLNASSSLHFPVQFEGDTRKVELTGEAYFEITKRGGQNGKMPFTVVTDNQEVTVLGTDFNINAYADDGLISTTLLNGAVKVSSIENHVPAVSVLLKPGQKAVKKGSERDIAVLNADMYEDMAWKKGYFIFNNENIKVIMKKLARWYDMDVVYQGDMSDVAFQGNYLRTRSLLNLLKTIELTNKVKFKIEGRRVIVLKQPIN